MGVLLEDGEEGRGGGRIKNPASKKGEKRICAEEIGVNVEKRKKKLMSA